MITALFLISCEATITDKDLPFEEKLVVRCVLTPGDIVDSLYVGRTLPYIQEWMYYNAPFDTAAMQSAVVTIETEGKSYPCRYDRNGLFRNDTLPVIAGKSYTLTVRWNGLTAHASTRVPATPVVDSVIVRQRKPIYHNSDVSYETEYTIDNYITSDGRSTISMLQQWILANGDIVYEVSSLENIVLPSLGTDGPLPRIVTGQFSRGNINHGSQSYVTTIRCYDASYYAYRVTNRPPEEAGFFSNPAPVAWNVEGDGIGIFIGASSVTMHRSIIPN